MLERLSPNRVSEPEPGVERLSIADAGPKVEALRSRTAQSLVAELGRESATATDLVDRPDTSLQNVRYHLSRLEDAGLVTAAGTRYSEKGAEMTVYARAVAALVIGGSAPPEGDTYRARPRTTRRREPASPRALAACSGPHRRAAPTAVATVRAGPRLSGRTAVGTPGSGRPASGEALPGTNV